MATYNNDMLAHVWAQQNESNGKNGNGSFSFTGSELYSYSATIAKFTDNTTVLFNTSYNGYSVTTSQHISKARCAIPSIVTVFNVPNINITVGSKHDYTKRQTKAAHKENVQAYKEEIKETVLKASRARSNKEWLERSALDLVNELNNYIDTFKLRFKHYGLPNSEEIKAQAEKARKAEIRKEKARKAKLIKDNQEKVKRWINGENVTIPHSLDTMLRINGDNVQTSKGAEFPIKHAQLALKIIERIKREKSHFSRNGKTIRLGHFQIDIIDHNGNVKAGCHYVKYEQIKRIASDIKNWKEE